MHQDSKPEHLCGELFEAVQRERVLGDSKTFVDAIPRADPELILTAYRAERGARDFDLAAFVRTHFELPSNADARVQPDTQRSVREHIEIVWDVLTRSGDSAHEYSTLIPLPQPYVVPGGRFRECYYWDSYFTMLGLAASGRGALVENMIANIAHLIETVGFVPNGNRTYFCSRSQPPVFACMVALLAEIRHDESAYLDYFPHLAREYEFWMAGAESLDNPGEAVRRVLATGDGFLNRYWDDSDTPRLESYAEDTEMAAASRRNPAGFFRDLRAACESGWDFSSRWLAGHALDTIRTTQIVPTDLNALLYKLETVLTRAAVLIGDSTKAAFFEGRAQSRQRAIQTLHFSEQDGFFVDLVLPGLQQSPALSLAAAWPLFFEIATPDQARRVAKRIEHEFMKPGGWVCTLNETDQQWDAPNGWAPLHWVTYRGLVNYGFGDLAQEGARRWVANNLELYRRTGHLFEKYDVETQGRAASGGEYAVQDGFGWTNAVLLCLMDALDNRQDPVSTSEHK